jgi:hypothetical protein
MVSTQCRYVRTRGTPPVNSCIIDAKRKHQEIRTPNPRLKSVEHWHFFPARRAPGCPDVQKDHPVREIFETPFGARLVEDWGRQQWLRIPAQPKGCARFCTPRGKWHRQCGENGTSPEELRHFLSPRKGRLDPWRSPWVIAAFRPIRRTRSSCPSKDGACGGSAASTARLHLHPPRRSPCPWVAHAQCRAPHLQNAHRPC